MTPLERLAELLADGRVPRDSGGYLDLLPPETGRPETLAQAAMHNPVVAAIYERWWRPFGAAVLGLNGLGMDRERRAARETLGLDGEQLVLDVACGPGNFTHDYGEALQGKGFAVGLDVSPPMLARAVRDNSGERVAYLRADARDLPFADGTFDAVSCFAALYLVPEPFRVIDELVRVLAPGGRLAVLTSARSGLGVLRLPEDLLGATTGLRMFGRDEVTGVFDRHGMIDVRQRITGFAQFVSARKP